jgi:uncharacterized RDD family membrane protein YckC
MEYSSIKRRLAAYIIDLVVVLGGGMLFLVGVMSVALGDQNPSEDSIWLILLPFVTTWLYFILCYIFAGVTLGKKLLGIKLVRENGKALNPIVVVMRETMKLFSLGLLNGLFSMFHDTNRRTWYDKAAGTAVVRTKSKETNKTEFKKIAAVLSGILILISVAVFSTKNSTSSKGSSVHTSPQEAQDSTTFASRLQVARKKYTVEPQILTGDQYKTKYQESNAKLVSHMTSLSNILSDSEKLKSIISGQDENGANTMIDDITVIQNMADAMSAITPPSEYKEFHSQYIAALKEYSSGCDNIMKALDEPENAEGHMKNMVSKFQQGNELIEKLGK